MWYQITPVGEDLVEKVKRQDSSFFTQKQIEMASAISSLRWHNEDRRIFNYIFDSPEFESVDPLMIETLECWDCIVLLKAVEYGAKILRVENRRKFLEEFPSIFPSDE